MRVIRSVLVLSSALLLAACTSTAPVKPTTHDVAAHDNLNATIWMQNSAEYQASVMGIYAAARRSLDLALADPTWNALPYGEAASGFENKPAAIIVDADETIIDNSPFQARSVIDGQDYSHERWLEWVNSRKAKALPGALAFANYAKEKGVTIFYVTNRDAPYEVESTIANLRLLGFPVAEDASNVILRGDARAPSREKGERRRFVDRNYRVVMLMGDNLGDFVDGYGGTTQERQALIEPYAAWWGERWFMLPNPSYGSWQNAIQRGCDEGVSARECARLSLRHDY